MQGFIYPSSIYLYRNHIDFRKSINGLVLIIEQELRLNAFEPTLFVFGNKTRDKIKCLYWDATGFALWYKRLENNRFKWPKNNALRDPQITVEQFQWLLSGYDIVGHCPIVFQSNG